MEESTTAAAESQANVVDIDAARQQLIAAATQHGPADSSLDQCADDMLKRIGIFFGECIGSSPDFCGFSIDELRDDNGQLLSLTLVPVDMKAGEPARRVGR